MTREEPRRLKIADLVVRLVGAWILSGALFKLLLGTPADLPSIVRELPLDLGLTYKLAISAEFAIAAFALLVPRVAWPAVAALMAVFCGILVKLWADGDANCGCFGSSVSFPPWAMLLIDGTLLVALLAQRPWRDWRITFPRTAIVASAVALILVSAPWILDREATAAPVSLPGYVVLDVESWVGQDLAETDLAPFVEIDALPSEGLWIFYRHTCEHCAEHLFELAATDEGERPITLLRIVEEDDTEANRIVQLLPEGEHVSMVELPLSVDWVVTTPAEFELEGGRIVSAREGF